MEWRWSRGNGSFNNVIVIMLWKIWKYKFFLLSELHLFFITGYQSTRPATFYYIPQIWSYMVNKQIKILEVRSTKCSLWPQPRLTITNFFGIWSNQIRVFLRYLLKFHSTKCFQPHMSSTNILTSDQTNKKYFIDTQIALHKMFSLTSASYDLNKHFGM